MKKLAIFDMDGTLYNTNDVNYYAYKEALAYHNLEIDYEYYCRECNGRSYKIFIPPIANYKEDIIEDVHNRKKELYSRYLDKVKVNEHLFNIIEAIKQDYIIVLVTTASKKNTYDILEYTGKTKLFDLILTSDEIKNPKPNPEGFLLALEKTNQTPENAIIFEDSEVGIEAALKTKATVMAVKYFR